MLVLACNTDAHIAQKSEEHASIFKSTFALGRQTTFKHLHESACEYWGLNIRDFCLYTIAERLHPQSLQENGHDKVVDWLSEDCERSFSVLMN